MDDRLEFKRIKRELKYEAHRVKVYEDEYERPDKVHVHYDYVENRNGAGVLLVDDEGMPILVKQYRITLDRCDLEIAAGCYEDDESETKEGSYEGEESGNLKKAKMAALREAEEETGLIPAKLELVNNIIAAVGLFSERTAIFIGTDLKEGKIKRDPDEFIDLVKLSLDEALNMIKTGEICDSKTIIAILYYALNINVK